MISINKENFDLKKFKVDGRGRVSAKFSSVNIDGEVSYSDSYDMTSARIAHPDLIEGLEGLRMDMAVANDLLIHRNLPKMSPAAREKVEKLGSVFKSLDNDVVEAITITGFSLKGSEDDLSVVITGKRDVKDQSRERYTSVALNSPKIMLSGDKFGIENELSVKIEEIVEEVYLYFIERKSNQAEIKFPEAEETAA